MAPRGMISVATMVTGGEIEVVMMVIIEVIEVLMMADMDLGLKIPDTITIKIWKKRLMAIGEVDISPIPGTLYAITQVTMVYYCVYLLIIVV